MFLVATRSDILFGFGCPFFASPIERASKIARLNSRVPRKKFIHPWYGSQLQSKSSSCEEEQEDILFFYFILKIRCFDAKKITLFWF